MYISGVLGVKPNTALKIYKRWEETGDCVSAPRSGVPKKLTDMDLQHIKRHIWHDRETGRQTLGENILDLNFPISETTLKRTLVMELDLGSRIEQKDNCVQCLLSL
jgi:hypothetical protein